MTDKTLEQLVIEFIEMMELALSNANNHRGASLDIFLRPDQDSLLRDEGARIAVRKIVEKSEYQTMKDKALKDKALGDVDETDFVNIPDQDGWIPHTTGKQPVDNNIRVEVRYKNGGGDIDHSEYFCWASRDDITHYRIVEERKQYKLSEMWKVWYAEDGKVGIKTLVLETSSGADYYSDNLISNGCEVLAITRADATEFYEGEGLDD